LPLNAKDKFNCINETLQVVSETNQNLSRFSIVLETCDIDSREHYGNCLTPDMFKHDSTVSLLGNFKNTFIQNLLLQELFRGLPISYNCLRERNEESIVINVRFFPQSNRQMQVQYEFQASGSFQTHDAFNFLTCDGVRKKMDFMAYLVTFYAKA
jgi:hypothetical protein